MIRPMMYVPEARGSAFCLQTRESVWVKKYLPVDGLNKNERMQNSYIEQIQQWKDTRGEERIMLAIMKRKVS